MIDDKSHIILNKANLELYLKYVCGKLNADFSAESTTNAQLLNLLEVSLTDKNGSSAREQVIAHMLDYQWQSKKLGIDAIDLKHNRYKEIKPTSNSKMGKASSLRFNFNDVTRESIHKYEHTDIVVALFQNCRLIIVLEFPFSVIEKYFNSRVEKMFTDIKHQNKRKTMNIGAKEYISSPHLKVHYIDKELILAYNSITKKNLAIIENATNYVNIHTTELLEHKIQFEESIG